MEPIESAELFTMGFEDDAVGRALVRARGNAMAALKLLRIEAGSDEEDDQQLQRALKMSLGTPLPPENAHSEALANPLWAPPRYVPSKLERGGKLNVVEEVMVRDGAYTWQRASAFLDTGNQHMTIVDPPFAKEHAIYCPDEAPLWRNHSGSAFGQAERWTTIRGVVPGATTRAPVVTIALKVRDEEMVVEAAVNEMASHHLLVGAEVLTRLFAAGYSLGAGSM